MGRGPWVASRRPGLCLPLFLLFSAVFYRVESVVDRNAQNVQQPLQPSNEQLDYDPLQSRMRLVGVHSTNKEDEKEEGTSKLFGEFSGFIRGANGKSFVGSEFERYAKVLGLEAFHTSRSGGMGKVPQDAFMMELVVLQEQHVKGPPAERPTLAVFAVADGEGPEGHVVSQSAVDGALGGVHSILSRKSTLPDPSNKATRVTMLKQHAQSIVSHALLHAQKDVGRAAETSSTTMTLVIWDIKTESVVTATVGDSPAFLHLVDQKTRKSAIKVIYANQRIESYAERKRDIDELKHRGFVPVAKAFADNSTISLYFGPQSEVQGEATTKYEGPAKSAGGASFVELSDAAVDDPVSGDEDEWSDEPKGDTPDDLSSGLKSAGDLESPLGDDNVGQMPPGTTLFALPPINPSNYMSLSPVWTVELKEEKYFDFRYEGSAVGNAIGGPNRAMSMIDSTMRREAVVETFDISGHDIEYLLLGTSGLTDGIQRQIYDEVYKKEVEECDASVKTCLQDPIPAFLEWGSSPQLISDSFDAAQEALMAQVELNLARALDQAVRKATKDPSQALFEMAQKADRELGISDRDDTTVIVVRPASRSSATTYTGSVWLLLLVAFTVPELIRS